MEKKKNVPDVFQSCLFYHSAVKIAMGLPLLNERMDQPDKMKNGTKVSTDRVWVNFSYLCLTFKHHQISPLPDYG